LLLGFGLPMVAAYLCDRTKTNIWEVSTY